MTTWTEISSNTSSNPRTVLTADRTYYVKTTGSDSNSGRNTNSAFLTIQKALDVVLNTLDRRSYNVTIDNTGDFTAGAAGASAGVGSGLITITSTAGATITVTGGNCIVASHGCRLTVNGNLTLSTVTSGICLLAYAGGYISMSGVTFGALAASGSHIQAGYNAPSGIDAGGGTIDITGNYTITGGGGSHLHATMEGGLIHYVLSTITVTLTGTPAFSNFFAGVTKGFIYAFGVTWSGGATGPRYIAHNGGIIFGPTSRTSFPGSTMHATPTASGGLYVIDDNDNDFGADNVLATGAVTTNSPTDGMGYATGAGGAITQATSRTTGVTLNKVSGAITLFTAAGSATAASFTVTNSAVAATDTISLSVKSSTTNKYYATVTAVAAGSFEITFNTTGGTTSDAPVFNFNVVKGVAA